MIQDIKDRVPVNVLSNDAIRYGIYDENGALLRYEYIKREDEPIETGTPINRALFSNIQGDLYTQDRYNIPVVTSEERMVSQSSTTNIFTPNGWTLVTKYTEYTRNGYELKAYLGHQASTGHPTYNPPSAFSGNMYWSASNGGAEAYLQIKLDSAKKITKMQARITTIYNNQYSGLSFNGAKIQGSFEGEEWVDLYEVTEAQETATEMTLNNTDYYLYYRIFCNALLSTSYNAIVQSWATLEWEEMIPKTFYTNNLSLPLKSYEVGKIVRIKGSSYIELQEVTKTGNIFPTSGWNEEALGIKYSTSDGYIITASSAKNQYCKNAFDNSADTLWATANETECWLQIECPTATKINKMKTYIKASINSYLSSIKIQGSKDLERWVDLYTTTTNQSSLEEVALSNVDYYKYYRIVGEITNSSQALYIYEWQTSEYIEIDEEAEITSFDNPYININNLGIIPVKGTIYKNNYYNLVFDGTQFLLESTRIDVTSATILATTSGTYTLNPDITYDVVAIGGGGGSWMDTDDCLSYGGGSGGYVTGTINNTSSIKVTIGAGGKNVVSYRPWQRDAGDGGTTIVGSLTAYGGTGASANGPAGTGGSYAGGTGQEGINGNNLGSTYSGYINGPTPTGWNLNGTIGGMYGAGGQIESEGGYDGGRSIYSGQNGVVAFIPQV